MALRNKILPLEEGLFVENAILPISMLMILFEFHVKAVNCHGGSDPLEAPIKPTLFAYVGFVRWVPPVGVGAATVEGLKPTTVIGLERIGTNLPTICEGFEQGWRI
ncbi:unnamed protein product [Caenorhabditis brenneri]